jgi:hypothetical protein
VAENDMEPLKELSTEAQIAELYRMVFNMHTMVKAMAEQVQDVYDNSEPIITEVASIMEGLSTSPIARMIGWRRKG